jgi:opacity protein-like surface antigen
MIGLAALLVVPLAWCQSAEQDVSEFGGYGGGLFGLGAHPYVGATAGLSAARYLIVVGDVSYAPLDNATIRTRPGTQTVQQSRLYDFNLSLHIRFPVTKKWAPYVIAGPSVLWDNFRVTKINSGVAVTVSDNETNFGFHTGAGVRYYVNDDWGIRPEFRVVITNKTYTVASVGIFYTFPN